MLEAGCGQVVVVVEDILQISALERGTRFKACANSN